MKNTPKVPELVKARSEATTALSTEEINQGLHVVAVTPTQVRRPWRSTVRTIFQVTVALATLLPFIAAGVYANPDAAPAAIAQVLAAAAAITRVMSLPQVEAFLRQFLPWLAAAPPAQVDRAA